MYRTRSMWRGAGLVAICVIAVTLLLPEVGQADPADDKARIDQQLARTHATLEAATDRARQAVADYTAAEAALPKAQAALADAKGRAVGARAALRQVERDAEAAQTAAATADDEFRKAAAGVERGRREVSAFVAATYKGGAIYLVNSVLDAESPADLASRIGYLDRVSDNQQRALDELTAARMLARQRGDAADAASVKAAKAKVAARNALDAALGAEGAAERQAAAVQTLINRRAYAMKIAQQERGAVLARYRELKAESDRLAAELRAAGRNRGGHSDVPSGGSSGFLKMPVSGWKSSNFGMRYDPYYHVWQLHPGTDFAAGNGKPIWAAADGRVVRAGWYGGYGKLVCVYHGQYQGRGLTTCYAHQSRILVSVGQRVRRGEVIGRVGTTGASTGYHLHFEVRIDGRAVNPIKWLPRCLC